MLRMAMEWIKREASLRVFCDCYCHPTIRPNRGQIQSVHLICCSMFGGTEAAQPRVPRLRALTGRLSDFFMVVDYLVAGLDVTISKVLDKV